MLENGFVRCTVLMHTTAYNDGNVTSVKFIRDDGDERFHQKSTTRNQISENVRLCNFRPRRSNKYVTFQVQVSIKLCVR